MDRNITAMTSQISVSTSLSARRAWIEIIDDLEPSSTRKSLSARRAWIEICGGVCARLSALVALRKESVDRNTNIIESSHAANCRSPQGERG